MPSTADQAILIKVILMHNAVKFKNMQYGKLKTHFIYFKSILGINTWFLTKYSGMMPNKAGSYIEHGLV